MAEKACHVFTSTTRFGLTQALGLMWRFVALTAAFLASCTAVAPAKRTAPIVLRGVPGNAKCLTPEPYSGSFAVLQLAEPINYGSLHNVTQVELIMDEPDFVQYGRYIGKISLVSCHLSESGLCGYSQVLCGISSIRAEP